MHACKKERRRNAHCTWPLRMHGTHLQTLQQVAASAKTWTRCSSLYRGHHQAWRIDHGAPNARILPCLPAHPGLWCARASGCVCCNATKVGQVWSLIGRHEFRVAQHASSSLSPAVLAVRDGTAALHTTTVQHTKVAAGLLLQGRGATREGGAGVQPNQTLQRRAPGAALLPHGCCKAVVERENRSAMRAGRVALHCC